MRIWSLEPAALDRQALVACWRETLLAQAVLSGATKGYRHHPQLERFRAVPDPLDVVGAYLTGLADEADARGYRFDRSRIQRPGPPEATIPVTSGQLRYEWDHLGKKFAERSPERVPAWESGEPRPHPLFVLVDGPIAEWERP